MDSAEREALFERTLQGEYDSDEAWAAVYALHRDASQETFDRAIQWSCDADPLKRARAVDILCQIYSKLEEPPFLQFLFRNEAYARIIELMDTEQDPSVILSGIYALGHLHNEGGVPRILRYLNHPDRDFRYAVTMSLGHCANHPDALSGLMQLCTDTDREIRDWAMFGLGSQEDADSEEIRATLLRGLDDEHENVREEAAVGLAKRKSVCLLPKLFVMLDNPDFTKMIGEAAARMLGMEKDVEEWTGEDYKAALRRAYPDIDRPE
ncbi:MAG: HEAT repeat domain-containing protein [Bryobacteraceae bacterium]